MSTIGHFGELAKRYLLISNILNSVNIDKLNVPEVISEESSEAFLNCIYSGAEDSVVRWLFNGSQVYYMSPKSDPLLSGSLDGRIDLSHRIQNITSEIRQAPLRIIHLSQELSGDYTCVVQSSGQEVRQTKTMIIYSPERDLTLDFNMLEIKCTASRIYPKPELTIEYNKFPIAQQQRVWRNGGYFDTECIAMIPQDSSARAEIACRLQIPQVDYTAITKKFITNGKETNAAECTWDSVSGILLLSYLIIVTVHTHTCLPL